MNQSEKDNNDFCGKILFFIILPGLSFSFASWMYLTIPENYRTELRFRARALLTSGVVTKIDKRTTCYGTFSGCSTSCDMLVRFQTSQGAIIKFSQHCTSASENQTVPVLYDPSAVPLKVRVDVGDSPESRANNQRWFSLMLTLSGVGFIAMGFSNLIKNTKNN